MPRPKEFDPDVAVERAMDAFWCGGYEGTSIQDLVDRLGVGRASLYGTFGSKEALWERALDRYREREGERALECLTGRPPLEAIRALFEQTARDGLEDRDNRGCLMVNAAMERGDDPATQRRVRAAMESFETQFRLLLERAGVDGDPAALARFLVTALQGVRVMAKATRDERTVRDSVEIALRTVGA